MKKTAKQKAKSGLLLVNATEIDSAAVKQPVHYAPQQAALDDDPKSATADKKPSVCLQSSFSKSKKNVCDGFGIWALAMITQDAIMDQLRPQPA